MSLVLRLIVVTFGILFAACPLASGQVPEPSIHNEGATTVAGRVLGEASLQSAEVMVVILLPGWSERLSAEIAAGTAPMVALQSGRVAHVIAASGADVERVAPQTGVFEFQNVAPGEYQPIAVRMKSGAETGSAIAEGTRVIVAGQSISDLELAVTPLPLDYPGKRHGGAAEREAAVLESSALPTFDIPSPPFPPSPSGPTPSTTGSSGATKKDFLGHIIAGIGIVVAVLAMSR